MHNPCSTYESDTCTGQYSHFLCCAGALSNSTAAQQHGQSSTSKSLLALRRPISGTVVHFRCCISRFSAANLSHSLQIPPICSQSIFGAMLSMYVLNQPSSLLSPEERGCAFFKSLKLFLLEQQQRSVDPIQTGIISALRVTDPQVYPITKPIMGNFDFISTDDIRSTTLWELAPIIVALNMNQPLEDDKVCHIV